MAREEEEGPLGELAEHGVVEPVMVREHGRWHRTWRITRLGLIIILLLAVIAMIGVYIQRKPIADNALKNMFEDKGVQASYHLDRVGLRTQQVSDLVIGDPADPDLVAKRAIVQLRILLNGKVEVYRVYARGVRLKGELRGSKVSWGQVDKLLPPPSGKPFSLPDLTVDIADTTIRLKTPFGVLGFAVAGHGNLSGGFKGRLAAASPRLQPGRCALERFRANVAVAVEARSPIIDGPVSAQRFACPASGLAIAAPRMDVKSKFSEAFGSFDGKGVLSFDTLVSGGNALGRSVSKLSFSGDVTDIRGDIAIDAAQARLGDILAASTTLKGDYRLRPRVGALDLRADYDAKGVALGRAIIGGMTDGLKAVDNTPLGPIAGAIRNALLRATGDFAVAGRLVAVNRAGGGGVRIQTADAKAASGGTIRVGGGDGVTYYWPSGRVRLDGTVETSGGGLPQAVLTLNTPRQGGAMSGTLLMAPYVAGRSRLALEPVRFTAASDGSTLVDTVARLDGPFDGGAVRGLVLPVRARIGGNGGFDFGRGCLTASVEALRYGGLSVGRTRVPICPTSGGTIVRQLPGGRLMIGATTSDLAVSGQLGRSPFALNADRFTFTQSDRFNASGLDARIGDPAAPVRVSATTLTGTIGKGGAGGTFAGGRATIGRVPLLVSEASGTWQDLKDQLQVNGAATVSDRADPPRFYPLRSNDLRFVLAGDRIAATGSLRHPASGALVTNVDIAHNLSSGEGRATLDVPGIVFNPNGLQPSDLTRLAEGVVALVDGRVNGQGRIAWGRDGKVNSTGAFNIVDTDLAAPFGPVTGLNTTVEFTDLLGLKTRPGGIARVATINPGILVENGIIRYSLLGDQMVRIERGEWPFMGGTLVLRETVLNFGRPTAKRLTFEVIGLDAHKFVTSMGFKDLNATGIFDGVLPMIFDESGGRIVGGRLDSRPGGGVLQYNGVVSKAKLGLMGKIAFDTLRHLRYRSMVIRLDGYLDGEFATRLTIDQVALADKGASGILRAINRVPFKFNVTIKGPFRALIATAKSFSDPTGVINDLVPIKDIPGLTYEVRRKEEDSDMTQTPPGETITPTATPTPAAGAVK